MLSTARNVLCVQLVAATTSEPKETKLRSGTWDSALWISLCLLAGALCLQHRVLATLGAGVVFALTYSRLPRLPWLCAVLAFAFTALRAEVRVAEYERQWQELRPLLGAPQRCFVRGEIVRSPVWRGDAFSLLTQLDSIECDGRRISAPAVARLYGGPRSLVRGDRFEAVTQLGITSLFRNLDLADPTLGAARSNTVLSGSVLSLRVERTGTSWRSVIDRARAHVRERIERTFAAPAIGMAKALVLGENDLSDEEDDAFKQSGLAHLLAVSGTHLVFAVVSLVSALRFVLVRIPPLAERTHVERWSSLAGVLLALLYADFAGGSGSAWRAAWMLAAAFLMRTFDRKPKAARAVAVSIVVGVAFDPLAVFDISFMLSLAATSGLLTLGRRFAPLCDRLSAKPVRMFAQGLVATLSSMAPCSGLLALLSPLVSLPGIVMNVLAAPFGEIVALPLCLSHALLAPFPSLEQGVAHVASGALLVVKQAAFISTHAVQHFAWLGVPLPLPAAPHFVVLTLALVLALLPPRRGSVNNVVNGVRRYRALVAVTGTVCLFIVEIATMKQGSPRDTLRVSVLDVGQGDSALVDLPDGKLMLIDAGGFVGSPVDPGERVVLPVLRARRRPRLDVVVLSHPHPDHFGGLLSVVRNVEVGEFWDTGQGSKEGAGPVYAELLKELAARHIPVRTPAELCGTQRFGGAEIDVLAPCPSFVEGRNANDNSWVFRLRHGSRAVLFTGDAEEEEEHELVQHSALLLRADLLKVGHHGSRTSTSAPFLAAVKPTLATISCGARNTYGHPHAVTLNTLAAHHVRPLRIDDLGGVEWSTNGNAMTLKSFAHDYAGRSWWSVIAGFNAF